MSVRLPISDAVVDNCRLLPLQSAHRMSLTLYHDVIVSVIALDLISMRMRSRYVHEIYVQSK